MPPQLTRLMLIFGVLIALYVVMRWVTKPDSFYWYGHYRGAALAEVSDQLPVHATPDQCAECHDDVAALNRTGVHSGISCITCHGPGNEHVTDPTTDNIIRPVVIDGCLTCHLANHARPDDFPQVEVPEHNDEMSCDECHVVHSPGEMP